MQSEYRVYEFEGLNTDEPNLSQTTLGKAMSWHDKILLGIV